MKDYTHKEHFLSKSELLAVHRYQQITANYLNMFLNKESSILDVGASEGYMENFLTHKLYFGIDVDPESEEVHQASIFDVTEGSFDLIIYNHVLEHVPAPANEIIKANELLKPDGYLFIAVPHAKSAWSWQLPGHINMFNEEIVERLVRRNNFKLKEQFTICFREDKIELWTISQKVK